MMSFRLTFKQSMVFFTAILLSLVGLYKLSGFDNKQVTKTKDCEPISSKVSCDSGFPQVSKYIEGPVIPIDPRETNTDIQKTSSDASQFNQRLKKIKINNHVTKVTIKSSQKGK